MKLDTLDQAIAYLRGLKYKEVSNPTQPRSFCVTFDNNNTWVEVCVKDGTRFAWVYNNRNGGVFMRLEN